MLIAMMISLGSIAAAIAILALVFGPTFKREARSDTLLRTGVPAVAIVNALHDTGARINQIPVMRIDLTVTPSGGAPFSTVAQQAVSPANLDTLRPGRDVAIRYDPKNPGFVAISGPAP